MRQKNAQANQHQKPKNDKMSCVILCLFKYISNMSTYIVFREEKPRVEPKEDLEFQRQLQRMLEKQCVARVNSEHFSSVQILKDIVSLCKHAQQWHRLNQLLPFLLSRRGQSKRAQTEVVQLVMTWLPAMQEPQRTALLSTLRQVTAKKIFLEVEHARCVLQMVRGKEQGQDIGEAAALLQEVQVQTYGSMDRREKLEFILYQMKILLKKQDHVRFFIVSKKINENSLNDSEIADLKLTYFAYMAIHYNHQNDLSRTCHAYRTIYNTLINKNIKMALPEVLDFNFSAKLTDVLSNYVGFLVLQPYSASLQEELRGLQEKIEGYAHCQHIIRKFLAEEIVSCNVNDYRPQNFELFRQGYPRSEEHLQQLRRMLIQHDLRLIAKYYSLVNLKKVSQLLKVQEQACEDELCALNNAAVIRCRIDRIDSVVDFTPLESQQAILKHWDQSVNSVLDLVDLATQLIHRERKVHKKA